MRLACGLSIIIQPWRATRSSTSSTTSLAPAASSSSTTTASGAATFSYADVGRAARGFAARLHAAGLRKGDKVVFFSENRPEWIVAFWGCLLCGVVVVPIDYRSSPDFLARVSRIVAAKLVLVGQDVPPIADTGGAPVWQLHELDWARRRRRRRSPSTRDDVAEIIFTSGATAEPKGVVITHRNVLANIVPVEREVLKYRKWGRPFFPLRFLNLLPLSHMFGQAMATFIPPMLPGVVVFMRGYNPGEIVAQIKKPAHLGAGLGAEDPRRAARARRCACGARSAAQRAAQAAAKAPVSVSLRALVAPPPHPSAVRPEVLGVRRRRGAARRRARGVLGRARVRGHPGLRPHRNRADRHAQSSVRHQARLGRQGDRRRRGEDRADDGEILVRGENVTTGYFNAAEETARAFEDGWFHTGDIGEIGADGQLFIRGRKKEMIVTPEGLNVFPEDVERVLNQLPGVRDSAVVGVAGRRAAATSGCTPCSSSTRASIPTPSCARPTPQLADHQRIRRALVWPEPELPRTEGTRKLKRAAIRDWVQSGGAPRLVAGRAPIALAALVAKYAGRARRRADGRRSRSSA